MRNNLEKVMPRSLISAIFLVPKSTQERKKRVLVSVPKSYRFLYRFFLDFSSILEPNGHLKIEHFSWNSALGVALGVSWRQEGPQSAPREAQETILGGFWNRFGEVLDKILDWISMKIQERFDIRCPRFCKVAWHFYDWNVQLPA